MAANLVNVTIDETVVGVPPGTNLIEAAKVAGVEVPHYCYHQRLTVAGNCRMCLVDVGMPKLNPEKKPEIGADGKPVIAFMPKLQIACNTPVAEGMVCLTRSPKVEKARQGVMEFLLINHPLDCPICDQAGECRLQEFAVDYGRGGSRFDELKVHKPKKVPLGAKITLDTERCIMCSRCERFTREVAGQDCLGFTRRGSHVELTCYPGQFPNTNYDLNIVDICPVGALTSNDFRFRMRPWFLKETRSICPHCATGCNTVVSSRESVVYRQQPRDNNAVNQGWMCDEGRLNYRFINRQDRLTSPRVNGATATWRAALSAAVAGLRPLGQSGKLAAIGSARATTEEQFLFAMLAREVLGTARMDCVPRTGAADNKLVSADRNPNSHGVSLTGLAATPMGSALATIAEGIRTGTIRGLLVHGENVARGHFDAALLKQLELLVVIDILPNAATEVAHIVLPGAAFVEKRGTFINRQGRLQRFLPAMPPPGEAREDWHILASLIAAGRPGSSPGTFDAVFAGLTQACPALAGLTFAGIGDLGVQLDLNLLTPARKAGEPCVTEGVRT